MENKRNKEIDLNDENLLKLRFTDYLYNAFLIDDFQVEICNAIEKSNSKRKEFKSTMSYNLITTVGGKSNDQIIEVFNSNRDWLKIERILKKDAELFEKTICNIKTAGEILKDIGTFEDFIEIVNYLCLVLEELEVNIYGDRYEVKIKLLNRKVREYGINRAIKKTGIKQREFYKIIEGDKNYKYYNLEKLLKFFEIE